MKRELALLLALYAGCVALAAALWYRPLLLAACYVVVSLLVLARWHAAGDLVFYALTFLLGPLGELVAVHAGAWTYHGTQWPVPPWLPLLWGIVAVFLRRTCDIATGAIAAGSRQRPG